MDFDPGKRLLRLGGRLWPISIGDATPRPVRLLRDAGRHIAGTFARIASWLPLYALYAMRRTRSLAIGEFLSMPLFAVLLATYPGPLSLEAVGALWLAAYAGYGLFNLWAVRRAST